MLLRPNASVTAPSKAVVAEASMQQDQHNGGRRGAGKGGGGGWGTVLWGQLHFVFKLNGQCCPGVMTHLHAFAAQH